MKEEKKLEKLVKFLEKENLKDEVLDAIASFDFNVAQFVSFSPYNLKQRFGRIHNYKANHNFESATEAIAALFANAQEKKVNVRTFKPDITKGNPFNRGLKSIDEVVDLITKYSADGYFVIVNESIDIYDGGVSGVVMGNLIEFSPKDTPKSVDKPGVCSLERDFGIRFLQRVYGFKPNLDFDKSYRVEFSIHPSRRGVMYEHTIIWEIEQAFDNNSIDEIYWPNNFSKFLGDKVFGLLIADQLGLRVPLTTVIGRNVAPFTFGKDTGTGEVWIRTAPNEKTPGYFPTFFGWVDPFKMMIESDPDQKVNAIISQDAVEPVYSGAMVPTDEGYVIEGVKGKGDEFMVGKDKPVLLPPTISKKIKSLIKKIKKKLTDFSFEWVYDGNKIWIVQLNLVKSKLSSDMIFPGEVASFIPFQVERGLEELRELVFDLQSKNIGIELKGDVGITSHFGDVLRNGKIPSKLTR
jgi:hypothetical protein